MDEYVRKYGVQTTVSMWSALRRKHARDGAVVHYDRALTSGWSYVLRRDGIDLDLIREPKGLSGSQDRGSNAIAVEVLIVYGDGRAVPFDPLLLEAFGEHSR